MRLNIGLDVGGTSSRIAAQVGTEPIWTTASSAGNPRIVGIEHSVDVIVGLVRSALDHFNRPSGTCICAGVAGAAAPEMKRSLADAIRINLNEPDTLIEVTDDATVAFEAAFKGGDGVLLIIGTGSIILARHHRHAMRRSGGWGYLLGDEGSGYNLGRDGLRAVASALDSDTQTVLATRAAVDLDMSTREELLAKIYGEDFRLAEFAPVVLAEAEAGDKESIGIVDNNARELVDRLGVSCREINARGAETVKLSGGLSQSHIYVSRIAALLKQQLPGWDVVRSGREPVEGALWLASRMPHESS